MRYGGTPPHADGTVYLPHFSIEAPDEPLSAAEVPSWGFHGKTKRQHSSRVKREKSKKLHKREKDGSQRRCCQGSSADLCMCERIRASAGVERPADGDSASLHTSATQPQQHLQSGDAGAGTQAEIHQPIDAPPHPTSEEGREDAG